jgi:stress response protein YsnF
MKYRGVTIENTPTEKFPELVTISKTTKKVNELLNKKFISTTKAINAVDAYLSEIFIEKTKVTAYKDILKVSGADIETDY